MTNPEPQIASPSNHPVSSTNGAKKPPLREALVQATLELVEEVGPAAVSVREVARRAGVSSGAPFRHFPDKYALMAAVAEEGVKRLNEVTEAAIGDLAERDPLEAFRQAGLAYVRFAVAHPAHFRVICVPEYAAYSQALRDGLHHGRAQLKALIVAAQSRGAIIQGDPESIMLAANAMIYGVARMFVDGQMQAEGIGTELAEESASTLTELLGRGIVEPSYSAQAS